MWPERFVPHCQIAGTMFISLFQISTGMKSVIAIIVGLLLLGSTSFAQQSENKRKLDEAKRKAADERSRSFGKRSSTHEEAPTISKNDPGKPQKKSVDSDQEKKSKDNSGLVIDLNEDQTKSKETRGANTDPAKSNAPAVIQTTTSESGSPAILSGDNGNGRDGTNNVQRGTLKMAGAEVKGDMGLYKKDAGEKNIRTPKRISKQEEQPQRITERPAVPQNSEATVQETSSQQEESVVKKTPEKKDEKKSKGKSKKSRKGKSRDSGK